MSRHDQAHTELFAESFDRFTGLAAPQVSVPETCTDVCPTDITPADNFIRFRGSDPRITSYNVCYTKLLRS